MVRHRIRVPMLLALLASCVAPLLAQTSVDGLEARRTRTTGAARLAVLVDLIEVLSWQDPREALAYADEAQTLLTAHPDPDLQRRIWLHLGLAEEAVSAFDAVLERGAALEAWAESAAQLRGAADGAYLQGLGHARLGANEQAIAYLQRALTRYEALEDEAGIGTTLTEIGTLQRRQGRHNEARASFTRALALHEARGHARGIAALLVGMGAVDLIRGHYEESMSRFARAQSLYETAGDRRGSADALAGAGHVYRRQGRYEEAWDAHTRALALREAVGDRRGVASSLNNIGILHWDQGSDDEALAAFTRSLALREGLDDQRGIAQALSNIGNVYAEQGAYAQALAAQTRALRLLEALGDRENVARTQNNIGLGYFEQGRYEEALDAFTQALELRQALGDRRGIASSLQSIGLSYQQQAKHEDALAFYRRALAMRRELGDQRGIADTLQNIAGLQLTMGRLEEALTNSEQALELADATGEGMLRRDILELQSRIFEGQGRFAEALDAYRRFKAAYDALFNAESQGVIAELQTRYRTREQAQRIELLEQRQRIQRLWVGGLVLSVLLLLLIAGLLYSRYRIRTSSHAALVRAHAEIREKSRRNEAQAAQLRQLDEAKSRFFANVTHEFRTPLTLTLGPLDDVAAGRHGPITPQIRHELDLARRNAERLLGLINELLDIAKLEAGRLTLEPRPIDLSALLRTLTQTLVPLAERRQVKVTVAVPDDGVVVEADPGQIEKVFRNLLSNALDFTPAGGAVRVLLETADAEAPDDAAGTGGTARVQVRDSGPGIPAADLPHVFERFHKVDESARRTRPGTGIGLALARELTELHGGTIEVESQEGFGSTFTVLLPLSSAQLPEHASSARVYAPHDGALQRQALPALGTPAATAHAAEAAGAADRAGAADAPDPAGATDPAEAADPDLQPDVPTVLVVEDNADLRAYVRRHLADRYQVVEAPDGAAGLERARSLLPDLVLSDVMMPELDGIDLCRALKADPETDCIPVILLTARAAVEDRLAGLGVQADDYLTKPFDVRELTARVDNTIRSRQRLREHLRQEAVRPEGSPREGSPEQGSRTDAASTLHPTPVDVPSRDARFLQRVRQAIEARMGDEEFGVEALAADLGMSRSSLYRRLHSLLGVSTADALRTVRLQRAAQLLAAQAGSVSEVAYGVGFKSLAHFSRAFAKQFGMSPSAWRAGREGTDGEIDPRPPLFDLS